MPDIPDWMAEIGFYLGIAIAFVVALYMTVEFIRQNKVKGKRTRFLEICLLFAILWILCSFLALLVLVVLSLLVSIVTVAYKFILVAVIVVLVVGFLLYRFVD